MKCYNCENEFQESELKEFEDEKYCAECYSELFAECVNCNEVFEKDELTELEDNLWCDNCRSENWNTCTGCGHDIHNEDTVTSQNGDNYCQNCYDELFYHCESCGDERYRDNVYTGADDNSYCSECFHDRFISCSDCGEAVYNDDARYSDEDGEYYCSSCWNDSDNEGEHIEKVIHDYGYRPEPNYNKLEYDDSLFLGIELEVQNTDSNTNKKAFNFSNFLKEEKIENLFYLKHDGSIDNGFEIVTEPITWKYAHKNLKLRKILNWLKGNNLNSQKNGKCGLHIHLSKNFFTNLDIIKLRLFFSKNKKEIYRFSKREGQGDNFCQYEEFNVQKIISNEELDGRYWALNLNSSRETIELRAFRGTLNYDRFLATLQFSNAISNFVKIHGITSFVYGEGEYKDKSWKLFIDWSKETGKYEHMIKYFAKEEPCV